MKIRYKITFTTILLISFSFQLVVCQTGKFKEMGDHYKTWIIPKDNSSVIEGYLSQVGDSLTIVNAPQSMIFKMKTEHGSDFVNSLHANYPTQSISINDIHEIKFRKNSKIGEGALIGAIVGAVVGAIIGFTDGDQKGCFPLCLSAELKGLIGGIAGIVPGIGVGALLSSGKITLSIGENEDFQNSKLLKYQLSY